MNNSGPGPEGQFPPLQIQWRWSIANHDMYAILLAYAVLLPIFLSHCGALIARRAGSIAGLLLGIPLALFAGIVLGILWQVTYFARSRGFGVSKIGHQAGAGTEA